MKNSRVKCDICKIEIHRASYSRHLKSEKHLEKIKENKVTFAWKSPMKRALKEKIKVSDNDTNLKINIFFLIE